MAAYKIPFKYDDPYRALKEVNAVKEHVDDLTRATYYYPNGQPAQIVYKNFEGKIHNHSGPAIIRYAFSANKAVVVDEYYYTDGIIYLNKSFYPGGSVSRIVRYDKISIKQSNYHHEHPNCSDGPAVINFNRDGKPGDTEYWCINVDGRYQGYPEFLGKNLKLEGEGVILEFMINKNLLK